MNHISSNIQQVDPSIKLNTLFDNNLVAIALIDQSGLLLKMSGLFSDISNIKSNSIAQNILHFNLFDHTSFKTQFDNLKANSISEFAISHFVENEKGKSNINIKVFKVNKAVPEEGALMILEETNNECGIEEVIQIIGNSLEKSKDDFFFDTMCLSLSKSLGIGMIFIGEYIKKEDSIQCISFWNQDNYISNISYLIADTPTEVVMKTNSIRMYQDDIRQQFPNDSSLSHWNVKSYIGCPLLNSQGEFVGYIGLMDSKPIRNISMVKSVLHIYSHSLGRELERMTQKKKIESGERRYKAIYDQSPFGIVGSSTDGKLEPNPRFCQMLGYSKEELSLKTRNDIIHPDDLYVHRENLASDAFQKDYQRTFNKRYIRKNGSICHAKVTISNLLKKAQDLSGSFELVEDITDTIDSKNKLRDNQILMQSIIETAQDAVITFNHNDKVIEWNNQATVMFGYEKKEATNMNFSQFIEIKLGGNNKSPSLKELVKSYGGKVIIERMEVVAKGKDDIEFPAEISLSPIKVNDCYVYSTFIRDITTHKKYESILNQNLKELNGKNKELRKYIDSNLQLENFAHIASHDLKEPLRSIGNFSQLLSKRLENRLDETEQEFFNFILNGVQNMNQLIEDLLMYSSVNSQKAPVKNLNLNDVLFVVSRNLDKTILDSKAELIINKLPESFVSSDTKMKQLFQNLIANAIKFKKKDVDPRVEISCEDAGEFWKFKIEDNGIGIKEEFKDKIFMIFKKLHTKTEYQGTGIGLAVCKKIVDHHCGEIWVESEIGVGTIFYFTMLKESGAA